MTLLELCEPLFQYICYLRRSARAGASFEMSRVRSEIEGTLQQMREQARADSHLRTQFEKVELPLIFFVDFMIKESSLEFADQWEEIAFSEYQELAGDERFFDFLEETLDERGQEADERLEIYYTCIGLGFSGFYTGQPEALREKMQQISARIRGRLQGDQSRLCPEAYEHVDTTDLIEPPGYSLLGMGLALVGLVVLLLVVNGYLFHLASDELEEALDSIQQVQVEPGPGAARGEAPRLADGAPAGREDRR